MVPQNNAVPTAERLGLKTGGLSQELHPKEKGHNKRRKIGSLGHKEQKCKPDACVLEPENPGPSRRHVERERTPTTARHKDTFG